MKIDIIIPVLTVNQNINILTRECIHEMLRTHHGLDLNVIIVDSTTDKYMPFDYVKHFRLSYPNKIKQIPYDFSKHSKFNFNHSLNIGLQNIRPDVEYVVFSNNDVIVQSSPITKMVMLMKQFDIQVASPKDIHCGEQQQYQNITAGYNLRHHFLGYFFVCKRSLFNDLRFDEGVDFWYSDNLFLDQLKKIGVQSYIIPQAIIKHKCSSTLNTFNQKEQIDMTTSQLVQYRNENNKVDNNVEYPISALMITLTGENFVIPSIKSIYNHVQKIVLVHGNSDWLGNIVENKVKAEVEKNFPNDPKIIHLDCDLTTITGNKSIYQYNVGKRYIDSLNHWTMVVDCDEVWEDEQIEILFRFWKKTYQSVYYDQVRTSIKTFIKSIRYECEEPGKPTVLVRPNVMATGPRFSNPSDKVVLVHCHYNHYSYIRPSDEEIYIKGHRSLTADGNPATSAQQWAKRWMTEVWDKLEVNPKVLRHIHPNYPTHWKNLKMLDMNSVHPLVKEWFDSQGLDEYSHPIPVVEEVKKVKRNVKRKTK